MLNNKERTFARINVDNLIHNVETIKSTASGAKLLAVVKADAYGHGAVPISKLLEGCGIDYFGVSSINEACQLRDKGIKGSILVLGYTPPEMFREIISNNITVTVFNVDVAKKLNEYALSNHSTVKVHIKVDTGMSRLGFLITDDALLEKVVENIREISHLENLDIEGIFTHFAESDTFSGYTQWQFSRFTQLLTRLEGIGITFKYRHCCNSAGIINYPEMHLNMVRPGLILYGLKPADDIKDLGLKPVMELKSVISQIKVLPVGSTVSYGRTFETKSDITMAVIPIGYADGYPRTLSGDFYMLVNGKKAPILGSICMDMTIIDITGIDGCYPGLEITVFGSDGGAFLGIEEISRKTHTINYETACIIGKRVPRIYISGDKKIDYLSYINQEFSKTDINLPLKSHL